MSDTQVEETVEETEEKQKVSLRDRFKREKKAPAIELGGNIVVNLIPDSHKESVEAKKTKNSWTAIFGFAVLVSVLASGAMFAYNLQVNSQLETETLKQATIDLSIARHAEVHQAIESEGIAKQLLSQAAGNEVNWNQFVGIIEQQLPQGTEITSLAVTNGGDVSDEVSSRVILNLTSNSTFGYSDSLNAVEGISGVQQVEIGGLSAAGEGGYTYQMVFTYDTSILTERFALEDETTEEAPTEDGA